MKTKRILFLTLLFVLDSISPVIASGFAYIKNVNLEGFTCPTLSTHFNETSLSKIQCLSRCAESSSCYGAFHDQENLLCVGCGDRFLTSKSAPALTGMRYYQRSTYKLVTQLKSWDEAKAQCENLGGHLADITSEEEKLFIEKEIFESGYSSYTWIGASRRRNGGAFYWEDDTPLADTFKDWGNNEPNNNDAPENCVIKVWKNNVWAWHDYQCTRLCLSLCEFD